MELIKPIKNNFDVVVKEYKSDEYDNINLKKNSDRKELTETKQGDICQTINNTGHD